MKAAEFDRLLEKGLKGRLTPEERSRLEAHLADRPRDCERWNELRRLHQGLDNLPEPEAASNFTAAVLDRVRAEARRREDRLRQPWWRRIPAPLWLPAAATAGIVLAAVAILRDPAPSDRRTVAENVATVSSLASLPSVDLLKDYDAIANLGQVPPAVDEELLAALE